MRAPSTRASTSPCRLTCSLPSPPGARLGFTFRPLPPAISGQMVYDGPELYFSVKDGQPDDFAKGASEVLK